MSGQVQPQEWLINTGFAPLRVICGLTRYTRKEHIIRATLEAICFQSLDVVEAMVKDCGFPLSKVYADGSLSANNLLMQLQADLSGVPVLRSTEKDTTARGAAIAAGLAEGINILVKPESLKVLHDTFLPTTTAEDRNMRYHKWKMAVERSLNWAITTDFPEPIDREGLNEHDHGMEEHLFF